MMQYKNPLFPVGAFRRWLVVLMVLALVAQPLPARAEQGPPAGAREVMAAALDALVRQGGPPLALDEVREDGQFAVGWAARGPSFRAVLAEYQPGQGWVAWLPDLQGAAAYNQALERFPAALLDEHTQAFLWQYDAPTGPQPSLLVHFNAHKLPWKAGLKGYVTQKEGSSHENQIDFDIQGLAASGDVYASKPGVVWFVKQSNNEGPCTGSVSACWQKANLVIIKHGASEFSWYVHLAYNSVPVSVGQSIGFGTKIGVEGNTGYSFGVHLHYMTSTGHTTLTDPSNPNAAPWPTKGSIYPVDFDEYAWANLVVSYTSPYSSQNSADPLAAPPPCPALNGVILYRQTDFACTGQPAGHDYVLRANNGFQNVPASFNDAAASIRVPAGWSALLYEDTNRGGGRVCINAPGDGDLSGDLFDNGKSVLRQVSSFEVYPQPDCPGGAGLDTLLPSGDYLTPLPGSGPQNSGDWIELSAWAADERSGVREVRFRARWDGQWRTIAVDRSAPYRFRWDLCGGPAPAGEIELGLEVYDVAGNRYSPDDTRPNPRFINTATCQPSSGVWSAEYWSGPDLTGLAMLINESSGPYLVRAWGGASPGGGLPGDGWSARFARQVSFPGGNYRFHCQSDALCRVWVGGVLRIDGWSGLPSSGLDWSGPLAPGVHEVRVEYADLHGPAWLQVWWQGPGFLPSPGELDPNQWFAEYWPGEHGQGPAAAQRNEGETLEHDWGETGPLPELPADIFLARYQRSADLTCGDYRFSVIAEGGLSFWLDDQLLINQYYADRVETTLDVSLASGPHALRVEYIERSGIAGVGLRWEKRKACPALVSLPAMTRYAARPGAYLSPSLAVEVTAGGLYPEDGDRLVSTGGNLLGASGLQALRRPVTAGGVYRFDPASHGAFQMQAPAAEGQYASQWRLQNLNGALGATVEIQVVVDSSAPSLAFQLPADYLTSPVVTIPVVASDSLSGVDQVQFFAGYRDSEWAWRSIGWDGDGSDGWSIAWDASSVPDQTQVAFYAYAWDRAGNLNTAAVWGKTLDRNPPRTWISPLAGQSENSRFRVYFNGSDNLTGLQQYDVQISINGAGWQNWLSGLNPNTAFQDYYGVFGSTYAFRMRGIDKAGNVEPYPDQAETITILPCSGDLYELDDSRETASELVAGGPGQLHNICGMGDQDWAGVLLEAGQTYLIYTSQLGPLTDTVLSLYDMDGALLAVNDDIVPGVYFHSRIRWTPETSGLFYLKVQYKDDRAAGNAVTYRLSVGTEQLVFLPLIER